MEKVIINKLMRLINTLSIENKLEIISKLSENLKVDLKTRKEGKENLLDELFGVWSTMNEDLSTDILTSRTNSNKEISFD